MNSKRMNYQSSFKLKVIQFAKSTNNCAASRKFNVNEKLVRDWKKCEASLICMPSKKCSMRSGLPHWPELENELYQWVIAKRQNGYIVSRNTIKIQALKWSNSNPQTSHNFKASSSWCTRFMERKDLVIRQKTKISQKLPCELENKITSFQQYIIKLRKSHNFPLSHIGNMDEVPLNFDMVANRTVDIKGRKTIFVKTTGHDKTRFTVVLTCMADGTKLKPMIIFKRKLMPKIKFPSGVFVHVHDKGWMDEEGVKLWITNVWNRRPGSLRKESSLLVWDMFKAHRTTKISNMLNDMKTKTAVIPGGLTSVVQPLDVCLNKPFKDYVRADWNDWIMNGDKTYTKGGNMRAVPLDVLCQFVINAWDKVDLNTVVKSFKKCGISNLLDGTEDCLLWEDKSDSDDSQTSQHDWDPYGEELDDIAEELKEIILSDYE